MNTKRPSGSEFFKAQTFTQSLRALADSLPSEADKREVASQLDELIRFLQDIKGRLDAVPSREGAADVRTAIDRLDVLFERAKTSPLLGAALGLSVRPPRPKPQGPDGADLEHAKSTLARLEPLPIDE